MSERKKIEIRSDDVNEILTRPPGWIVRWGNTLISAIFILFVIGCAIFSYPDRLTAPIVVTSANLPAQLMAKTTGKVQELFKCDGDFVKAGEVIAMIENSADYNDYIKLRYVIDSVIGSSFKAEVIDLQNLPLNLLLGDMQALYNQLVNELAEYNNFIQLDYHRKKIALLKRELDVQRSVISQYTKNMLLFSEQFELASKKYLRDSTLYVQKVLSQADFESSRIAKLSAKQGYEAAKREIDELKISALKSEQSILDLEIDREKQLSLYHTELSSDYDLLKSSLRKWEQDYLLISPLNGKVSFTKYWQENQNVSAGEVVFTVLPEQKASISGKIYLPLSGAGKVRAGQKVNIKFDNYPYMEFGMVEVRVRGLSSVPAVVEDSRVYVVDVELPDRLVTNYGKELPFSEEMMGIAEIITDEQSILNRVIFPVKHIFRSRML